MDLVNSKKVKMSASQLPLFLFDQSGGVDLSETDEWFGAIFRSQVLLRVSHLIFMIFGS
jgi:hypothetical protein